MLVAKLNGMIGTEPKPSVGMRGRHSLRCLSALLSVAATSTLVSLTPVASADELLIEAGAKSAWKYLTDGSEPPAGWMRKGFDDSSWKTGRAPIGYGDPSLTTRVERSATKPITSYFRRQFEAPDATRLHSLMCLLCADDGAVLYLNGDELIRQNIAPGPVTSHTTAQHRIDGSAEGIYQRFLLPADVLLPGVNELAVEVHQIDADSSDLFLDLLLKGYGKQEEPQPATVPPAARDVTLAYRRGHYLASATKIPDGYADGGRRMVVDERGRARSDREVIVVDRTRDAALRQHLEYARSDFLATLPPMARARYLALYVDIQCSPLSGREHTLMPVALLEGEYANVEMLLGKSVASGVCRHRALLFKVLSDEAGLSVALARGHLSGGGGHAWNELFLGDGQRLIVDVMNPRGGFDFPAITDAASQQYLTIDLKPFYTQ